MSAEEKILKNLETPEGESTMNKFIKEYIEKENVKSEKIKILMSNTNYLEWLNQFTQDKEGFSDNDWLYFPEQISDSDKENVEKLCLFYEGINGYADSNHIYPLQSYFGNFYRIRLDKIGFEIGILIGQETVFFCNKVAVENEQEFIDFNDIMTGKKQEQVDKINANLESLSNMALTAYESGVPIESITYTLENTINKIISKRKNKSKTLTKK